MAAQVGRLEVIGQAGQALQDAAVARRLRHFALGAQLVQLRLQRLQLRNAFGHMADVLVQQGIDAPAILFGGIAQAQQLPHLIQGHVQRTAVADELQAFDVALAIEPVVRLGTGGLGQERFLLVIADSFHRAICLGGQFADLERIHDDPRLTL